MRIVIICTLYPPYVLGGAEISTSLLAKGLTNEGHEVTVITTGNKQKEEIVDGIRVYRVKNKNIYWRYPQRDKHIIRKSIWHLIDIYNIAYKKTIKELLCHIKPDIVHTGNLCGLSTIVWSIAKSLKIPIVHTLRDYYLLCPQQTMIRGNTSCSKQCSICKTYSIIKKNMSQKVDAVVGISNFILEQHLCFGYFKNANRKIVIANSVDSISGINQYTSNAFGYIGRLSPEKGIEFMIEAFLKSSNQGKRLLIAGTGNKDYEQTLRTKYESDKVVFLGSQNQLSFFKMIDALIVPSLWNEPFGRVVIEAYASKVPVFMSNNGGLKELQIEKISWCFDTNRTDTLINIINEFDKRNVDNSIFDKIVKQYSRKNIAEKYINLFTDIIQSHNAQVTT